jgi:hypothetical protein
MSEETKCVLCKADFRPTALVTSVGGVKKCQPCEDKWPKARKQEDIQVKNENKARTLDEDRVKELVYEILTEAGLTRHECEKCNNLFFRLKPMQKLCKVCDAEAEAKKTDGGSK